MRHCASPLFAKPLASAIAAILTLAPALGGAAPPPPAASSAPARAAASNAPKVSAPQIPFEKYALPNGLSVILHRDTSLPLVAVNLWYHVGPRNEPPGRSGFAHLFEHLMFTGSRHVGREFDVLLESVGATNVNGTTSWDRTNYFETVPREHLDLALWIESDRMGYLLDVLDRERLDVQRDVVKNERRQSYENAPYGPSYLKLMDALFPPGHPYSGAVIGSMADLSAATLDDVRAFFRAYYAPSNATLCVAGDFDTSAVKAAIEKYFASLPDRPRPQSKLAGLPAAALGRYVVEEGVELAQVMFGYRTPPAYSADDPVVDVTMALLAGGKATRLYRSLVVDKKLASEVSASQDSNELSSFAVVSATAATGRPVAELEAGIEQVLRDLEKSGPTAAELARAKRQILVATLQSIEALNDHGGEGGRAGLLQRFNHYRGDPGYLPAWVAAIENVSAADVQRVLREQLGERARVTVVTQPKQVQP